jgi:hypothetical protein|tara:strand:+ start:5523 stop:5741 length:219 start_codon:yes stop_codon:yes gene_type:complete
MSSTNKRIILFEYGVYLNNGIVELERSILPKEEWEKATVDLSENENRVAVANFLTHLKRLSEDLDTSLSTYF